MRALVCVNDAVGHVLPLLPLVRALAAAGHEVLLASPGSAAGRLAAIDGVTVRALPSSPVPAVEDPPPPGMHDARLAWAVRRSWPNDARGWAAPLLECAREFRPDVVVVEPVEHAGRVVAAATRVPWVEHGWGFTLPGGSDFAAAAGIVDLYETYGAAPGPPALRVDVGPESLQAKDIEADVERYRYQPWSTVAPRLPPARPEVPRVLVTLGTYDNVRAADRLRTAVSAVASLPIEVVVALGNADRGGAEGFPEGVLVADWLDVAAEVQQCSAVVHHAGAGLSMTTVTAGVPALCLPQGADQFRNAGLLAGTGAALVLPPDDVAGGAVTEAVARLLGTESYRSAARDIASDNDALPDAQTAVERLVSLAR